MICPGGGRAQRTAAANHVHGHFSTTDSPLRWPCAALIIVIAAAHVALVPAHLREAPYAAVLFIALAGACLMIAVVLIACDTRSVWASAGALTSAAALAYVFSRSVGLPKLGDDVGQWLDPLGVVALTCEAATTWLACAVLLWWPFGQRRGA